MFTRLIVSENSLGVNQERSQKEDSGCASEKLGVPHLLSDECKKKKSMLIGY